MRGKLSYLRTSDKTRFFPIHLRNMKFVRETLRDNIGGRTLGRELESPPHDRN